MSPSATLMLVSVLLLPLSVQPALAQTLDLPEQEPAAAAEETAVPPSGMSMADVERQFGPPLQRSDPVGEPPILVWRYDGFRVYFEYDRVIHSVTDKSIENGIVRAVSR